MVGGFRDSFDQSDRRRRDHNGDRRFDLGVARQIVSATLPVPQTQDLSIYPVVPLCLVVLRDGRCGCGAMIDR